MGFLTKKEIAEKLDINIHSLSGFIQSDPRAKRFFIKKSVLVEYTDKNGLHRVRAQKTWGFDGKYIIDFKRFWESRNCHKNHIDHNALLSWTDTTKECYRRRMQCDSTCIFFEFCREIRKTTGGIPPIKNKVLELYAKLGKPIGEEE